MKRFLTLVVLGLSTLGTGCAGFAPTCVRCHSRNQNNFPVVANKAEVTALRDLILEYRTFPDRLTAEKRNALIDRLAGVSDEHYITVRDKLMTSRNTYDFIGEVTSTALSAVSVLVKSEASPILDTASGLTLSTKISLDKNFFHDVSTQALVAAMDSDRAAKMTSILIEENQPVSIYGLEAALNDAREYDDAGTVQAAITTLVANTNVMKNANKQRLEQQRQSRKP